MKYQITCPKCKHEFAYNYGDVEAEIRQVGIEIQSLKAKLAEFKTLPYSKQQELYSDRKYWVRKLENLAKRKAELKATKQHAHDTIEVYVEKNFKRYVKEELGEARYIELWDKARQEAQSYSITETMKAPYSSKKPSVTSINKI